ncbi:hypothetical protein THARTR1_02325 [Trichoderma harzianum]|uniref:HMG box domain-containing protein n=1 Tax=Trichoderma harzianum TaxID=5544 RepID=A0A2K0UK85_TRIHA|nr:hypothetical protein THARTR1_02325 [Trichoderma harzianum]
MTANATISRDTLHSYSPARGVIERIKKEHEAHEFPSQLIAEYDQRIHPAAHIAGYGEGNRAGYVQIPGYYHPSQLPISPPLSREGTRADTKDNLVAPSQYPSEVSPLDYSHMSGAMPSEEPNDDAIEEESSEPPSKKRKTQKKKKKPVAPGHMFPLEATLSQVATAKGFNKALLKKIDSHVNRSTQVRHKEPRKSDGQPRRPINSFLVYRKTYRFLVKELRCVEKNEQNVSRLCAASWNLESEKLQQKFEDLAATDSLNHGKAFPGYKYAPSKSGKKDNKLIKDRDSTKTGRVTRKRKPASKVKELCNFSEAVLQRAIDEQQSLPAEAVHPQPYWTPVTVQTYPAPCPGEHAVYPEPHLYQTQTHYITTYDNGYSQSRISPPVVVYGLYEDTENPGVNYNENFIDPVLLQHQSESNLHNCSLETQQRSQPAPIRKSRAETGISSWDHDESHPPSEGGEEEWEVKELITRSEFNEWMTQAETEAQAQMV